MTLTMYERVRLQDMLTEYRDASLYDSIAQRDEIVRHVEQLIADAVKAGNPAEADKARAERMGYDCARNGANETNCDFRLFATPELTAAWERGKKRAEREHG